MSVVDELLIQLSVWKPSKYGEASANASHDQPYVHMIEYSITYNQFILVRNMWVNRVCLL